MRKKKNVGSRERKKKKTIKENGQELFADMRLGFVNILHFLDPDATGGVPAEVCDVQDEHDLDEEAGFRAAVTEGCAAVAWTLGEWEFKFPHEELSQGVMLIKCRPRGSTPVLAAFA